MMKLFSMIMTPALLFLSTCAPASTPAPSAPPAPALWKLADADTTIYLFGTIHVLPKGYEWRTPLFDKAAAQASELVIEVRDLDDRSKMASTFTALAVSPNLPPIFDRVPADKRAGLGMLINKGGFSSATLSRFESWAVALTLASKMVADIGLSPENGIEQQLSKIFVRAQKPVTGLETIEQQLGFFDTLPETAQRTFLTSLVDEAPDARAEFNAMIAAWGRGDDQEIALTFDDEFKLSPELADVLIRQRNENWTQWLTERLDEPGTILVAVGAGHLAGNDSVQTMLGKRGMKVTRIQ